MIKLDNVSKKFATGTLALSEVNLSIEKGEFVFLVGTTGSGKTTLLKILIRDVLPTQGKIHINDLEIVALPKSKVPSLRKKVGMVFQDLKLLADRTIYENVVLPLEILGQKDNNLISKVEEVLKQVGLIEHKDKFPIQLSGGELQRAAIARALILSPEILLADEPTGNLDPATSWEIVRILSEINKKGTTIIMATHNADIVKSMNKRIIHIEKGKIIKDQKAKENANEKEKEKEDEKNDQIDKASDDKKEEEKEAREDKEE